MKFRPYGSLLQTICVQDAVPAQIDSLLALPMTSSPASHWSNTPRPHKGKAAAELAGIECNHERSVGDCEYP
jgi:hypothetical protein